MLHEKTMVENENSEIINKLISRIPNELLANKDLKFIINEKAIEGHQYIDFVLKSNSMIIAYIGLDSKDEEGAAFDPAGCPERPRHYCDGYLYTKNSQFHGKQICPYMGVCNQVEAFITKYTKKYVEKNKKAMKK